MSIDGIYFTARTRQKNCEWNTTDGGLILPMSIDGILLREGFVEKRIPSIDIGRIKPPSVVFHFKLFYSMKNTIEQHLIKKPSLRLYQTFFTISGLKSCGKKAKIKEYHLPK